MRVAIFGVWHVHATDYARQALSLGEIVGFYEKDDALAHGFTDKLAQKLGYQPSIRRFATAEELLESDAEGVIVCSATCDHTEDIIRIANAGKHIFTEKVLALTDADCDRIKAAIRENGVSFTISLFQKYLGSRIAVKSVVDSGELGKISYVRFRNYHSGSVNDWLPAHFYNREQCGGGAMIDLGAHGMYLIEWLLGMPTSARSAFTVCCEGEAVKAKNIDRVEDSAVTVMTFADGAIAINETGFICRYSPVTLEVYGENGYVRMEKDSVVKCTTATGGEVVNVAAVENQPLPIVQFLTKTPLPGCSIEEAKLLTHMMVMAYSK